MGLIEKFAGLDFAKGADDWEVFVVGSELVHDALFAFLALMDNYHAFPLAFFESYWFHDTLAMTRPVPGHFSVDMEGNEAF